MSKSSSSSIDSFFNTTPSSNQKAWKLINQFYHLVLTKMEEDSITRADLARKLGKSRASVSQMFNKSPNLTIKKMIEISDAVNLDINLTTKPFIRGEKIPETKHFVIIPVHENKEASISQNSQKTRSK